MFKQEKGITLIALVITIIVLLILAGVSISMVAGDNGILSRATKAGDNTDSASVRELVKTAISSLQTEYADLRTDNNTEAKGVSFANWLTTKRLDDELKNNDCSLVSPTPSTTDNFGDEAGVVVKVKKGNGTAYEYKISPAGEGLGIKVEDNK